MRAGDVKKAIYKCSTQKASVSTTFPARPETRWTASFRTPRHSDPALPRRESSMRHRDKDITGHCRSHRTARWTGGKGRVVKKPEEKWAVQYRLQIHAQSPINQSIDQSKYGASRLYNSPSPLVRTSTRYPADGNGRIPWHKSQSEGWLG